MKSQVQYRKTQFSLLLIHLVSDFKKSFKDKANQAFYVRTALSAEKNITNS